MVNNISGNINTTGSGSGAAQQTGKGVAGETSNKVKKLMFDYLTHLEVEKNRAILTVKNYERYIKKFFHWSQVFDVSQITEDLILKYRLWLNRQVDEKGEPFKKVTQNYHIIALRGFLSFLLKKGYNVLSPDKVELGKQEKRQVSFLEPDEIKRLLEAPKGNNLRNLRDKAILEILFSSGLRVSELISLNREDINLEKGEFTVRGKGGKLRIVFLSESAKTAIKNYLDKRIDISEALFIRVPKKLASDNPNLRTTSRTIQRIIKKYAARAGIVGKEVSPHTLRHSFATEMLALGADIRSVQELLGHSSITTTQVYTHVTDPRLKEIHKKYHGKSLKENRES